MTRSSNSGSTVASRSSPARRRVDDFGLAMEVDVTALWHLSKLAAPAMVDAGGGSIVNVAPMLGHVGSTPVEQAAYCASKGAVVNLTREMALQWAREGVRVDALCPGRFPSEMTAGMESSGHLRGGRPRHCDRRMSRRRPEGTP